jgi:cell division protein FtsI (penicillin-binding protein 3)
VTVPISRWTKIRIAVFGVGFAILFGLVARRAYRLQVGDESNRLRGLAEEQYLREVELPPRRGRILDRDGGELASTADVDSVFCNPRQLPDPQAAARSLAKVLGIDGKELAARLAQRRFFAWVKRKVTPEEADAVRALELPGIGFTREPRRFYPNRTLAATVMGHAGSDGRGQEGVELALDRYLRGQNASLQGVRDALGRDLFVDGMGEPGGSAGSDVVLTIDRYLTFVTEQAIAEAQAQHHAKAVIALVMDPRNGELLAVASTPSYNPNDPSSAVEHAARNRAITDTFEPGSTMKTFTIAAALDARAVKPDDRFDCMMGRMMVGKYTIHDTHPHGALTVAEVFKFSSNIGATKIARRLGRDRLADALARFGFGHPTGVGLPGERSGMLRPVEKWGDIGFANVSFGQGLTVTPLQVVSGLAGIASGGMYHPPRIVARVVHADGSLEPLPDRPAVRIISARAAKEMTTIMEGVTQPGGTARAAAIDGYVVAGKTGTAQKVSGGHYDSSKWVSSFIGFVPAEAPRIAIAVMVDEPQGGHLGGAVAAPIFKEIAEQALAYLHVPPSPALLARKPPPSAGKGAAAGREAVPPNGPASTVIASEVDEDERPGSDVAEVREADEGDGTVDSSGDGAPNMDADATALRRDDGAERDHAGGEDSDPTSGPAPLVTIPSFRGLTIAAAVRAARRNQVALVFDDRQPATGVALWQSPAPGPAARGVVCKVAFGRQP